MAGNNESLKKLRTELIARRREQAYALCGANSQDEDRIAKFAHLQLAIEALSQVMDGGEEGPDLDPVSAMIG